MNLYDVLRLLVSRVGLAETQIKDSLAAIDESEQMHVLGTTAQRIDVRGHVHQYPPTIRPGEPRTCIYCPATEDEL